MANWYQEVPYNGLLNDVSLQPLFCRDKSDAIAEKVLLGTAKVVGESVEGEPLVNGRQTARFYLPTSYCCASHLFQVQFSK